MSTECCKDDACCAESASQSCCSGKCPCGGCCGGNPVECAKQLWCSSFGEALRQVHVDALKSRIAKAWGAQIDKGADAVVEAMGEIWKAKLSEAKVKSELTAKMTAQMFGGK